MFWNLRTIFQTFTYQTWFILKEVPHRNLKLACFVCYLKIINTFLKNNACILKQVSKELKNGILVHQGVLSYGSKQSKYCFDQKLKNRLAYLNFNAF